MISRAFILCLVSCLTAPGQTSVDGDKKELPSIEGVVVDSFTGAPINHAHVRLQSNSRLYAAMSTVDGKFAIRPIEPGYYSASVERPGYLMPPNEQSSNGAMTIDLTHGQTAHDLLFRLVPASAISGRVLDPSNEPVERIMVQVIRGGNVGAATTNDRGEFRIGGLRPGKYLVRAGHNGNGFPPETRTDGTVDAAYGPTYYPGTIGPGSALRVKTDPGQETTGVNIRLVRIPIVRLSGRIIGVPENAQGVSATLSKGYSSQSVQVGSQNKFTIWRLPPGTYWLTAQCEDITGHLLQGPPVRIDLADKNIDDIEPTFASPFALKGKVVGYTQAGSHSGNSKRRLQLMLGFGYTGVDDDGVFNIPEFRPGRYHIGLNGLREDEYIKAVRIGAADYPGKTLDLRNGAPNGPVEIVIGQGTGRIDGIVRDEQGHPRRGMVALLSDQDPDEERPATAFTDEKGSYFFAGVAPGSYHLFAFELVDSSIVMSAKSSEDGLSLFEPGMQKLEIGAEETRSLDLVLIGDN